MKRIIWLFVLFHCMAAYARAQSGTGAIGGTALELAVAAPDKLTGTVVLDLGLVEV